MPNPYGMTEFDAGAAFNAYGAGQDRRIQQMRLKQQMEAAEEAKASRTGVRSAIQAYAKDPKAPNARESLFNSLLTIDPQTAFETHKAFSEMSEQDAEAAFKRAQNLSRTVASIRAVPMERRAAARDQLMPQLRALGLPDEEIAGYPLDDEHLDLIINQGRDVEKIVEDTHPKLRNLSPGDIAVDERTGKEAFRSPYPKIIVGPNGEVLAMEPGGVQGAPESGNGSVPSISSAEQYNALPPGSEYIDARSGALKRKGGAGPQTPQTFP